MIESLARGWLVAWLVWSAVPVGSLVLVLIHRVTGGGWGEALAPALRPATALVPLAALTFVGVALSLPTLYPWAADPDMVKLGIAKLYLNPTLFDLRAAVALVGWSVMALLCLADRCGPLAAALGLSFYGLTISLVAVDWILSVEPHFTSSAFAAGIALHQILAALAWAAMASPPGLDGERASDLAGLILATLLGVLYMSLMSYIVAWYGDLPEKSVWYLKRGTGLWTAVLVASLMAGGLLPFIVLLFGRIRQSPAALRVVGLLVLIGVALHFAWYVLPAYETGAGPAAACAALGVALLALLSVPVSRRLARLRTFRRPRHV